MVRFKDFETVVRVGDRDLEEYDNIDDNNDDEDDDDDNETYRANTVIRYIEATSGARFSISCRYPSHAPRHSHPRAVGFIKRFFVDKVQIESLVSDRFPFSTTVAYATEYRDGKTYSRSLHFASFDVVEETLEASQVREIAQKVRNTGTIEVHVYRTSGTRDTARRNSRLREAGFHSSTSVPEKALKGDTRSHFVRFGEEFTSPASSQVMCDYIDEHPFVIFKFKYRSRRALETLRLIEPAAPTTMAALPSGLDLAEMSRSELEALVSAMQASRGSSTSATIKSEGRVKREGATKRELDDETREIMRSATVKRRRPTPVPAGSSSGWIDLTADD